MALTLIISCDQITEVSMRVRAGFFVCVCMCALACVRVCVRLCVVGYQYPRNYPYLLNNHKLSKEVPHL